MNGCSSYPWLQNANANHKNGSTKSCEETPAIAITTNTKSRFIMRPAFLAVKVAQVLCVVYILVLTFSYAPLGLRDPATGDIIDASSQENTENGVLLVNGAFRPVVARGTYELVCLGMSRMSAFSMYPVMVLAFVSKCKATLNYIEKTPISMFMFKVGQIVMRVC